MSELEKTKGRGELIGRVLEQLKVDFGTESILLVVHDKETFTMAGTLDLGGLCKLAIQSMAAAQRALAGGAFDNTVRKIQ